MSPAAIEIDGVTKRFGSITAVDSLSLRIPEQVVFGFLGPNGAGKTTLMRLLLGLIQPDEGTVSLFGHTMRSDRKAALEKIGSLIEAPTLYPHLSGRDTLRVTSTILDLPAPQIDHVLNLVGLTQAANRKVRTYSMGMRQRLGLARALLGEPRLLILDEPTNGLDPESSDIIRKLIKTLPHEKGCTVFLSSHMLSDVEKIADYAAIMRNGQIVLHKSLSNLLTDTQKVRIVSDNTEVAARTLTALGGTVLAVNQKEIFLQSPPAEACDQTLSQWNRCLVEQGHSVSQIHIEIATLESLYHQTTSIDQARPE